MEIFLSTKSDEMRKINDKNMLMNFIVVIISQYIHSHYIYVLDFHSVWCQLYFNKAGVKKNCKDAILYNQWELHAWVIGRI